MKVVIVEDEVRIREGIIKLLNKFYAHINEIHEAKSGEEGLAVIRRTNPDLVITDIRMEPMDGLTMLNVLISKEKRTFKTIILSAYSEFNYARQAISLGVSEYLVKPIEIGEFRKAMQHVEAELERERQSKQDNPDKLGSMETIFTGLISGQLILDEQISRYVENTFDILDKDAFALMCVYLGKRYDEEAPLVVNIVQSAFVKAGLGSHYLLFLPGVSELLFVFDKRTNFQQLERYLQFNITREINATSANYAVLGFTICESLYKIRESYENMHAYLPWNISLGSEVIISYPKIKQVQVVGAIYPIQIEKDSVEALCAMDYHRLNVQTESFLRFLTKQIYSPDSIKKCVIRYLLAILVVVKEINFPAYEKLDEGRVLEAVTRAVTYKELETVVFSLLETVMRHSEKSVGLLIQKVQRMVEEFYRQGITLEEISESLNMTSEHISAQFVRELGVNFSTYIKNYRLQKARELLLGTDLKLYEIASRIGYGDAKYFSRVFKESEGVLPAEYRKSHK